MEGEKKNYYYIVELAHPVNKNDKFCYVPEWWVYDVVDRIAIIKYPKCVPDAVLEKIINGLEIEPTGKLAFSTMVVGVKHKTSSINFAKKYTKGLNERRKTLFQNKSSGNSFTESPPSEEKLSQPKLIHSRNSTKNDEHDIIDAPSEYSTEQSLMNRISNQRSEISNLNDQKLQIYDKCSDQNNIIVDISEEISDDDFEENVKPKKRYKDQPPEYTPMLTDKPLKLKLLRNTAEPVKTVSKQQITDLTIDNLYKKTQQQTTTTTNNLSISEKFSQELRTHLTKTVQEQSPLTFTAHMDQNVQHTNKMNSTQSVGKDAQPECRDNQSIYYKDPSDLIREDFLNAAYLQELNKVRLCLNDIFKDHRSLDVSAIRSKMTVWMKKLEMLNNFYSHKPIIKSSQEPAAIKIYDEKLMVGPVNNLEKKQDKPVKPIKRNKTNMNKSKTDKRKRTPKKKEFILPSDYNKYDSRWTLRYREREENLVELVDGSGIYVSKKGLFDCKKYSHDINEFARRLLSEVFSVSALKTCSFAGGSPYAFKSDGYVQRPGLDNFAKEILLQAVEEHAREINCKTLASSQSKEMFTRSILTSLRNKINHMRD